MQGSDGSLTELIVHLEEPRHSLIRSEASIVQCEQRPPQRVQRLVLERELGGDTQHPINADRREMVVFDQAMQLARGQAPALAQFRNGQVFGLGWEVHGHALSLT